MPATENFARTLTATSWPLAATSRFTTGHDRHGHPLFASALRYRRHAGVGIFWTGRASPRQTASGPVSVHAFSGFTVFRLSHFPEAILLEGAAGGTLLGCSQLAGLACSKKKRKKKEKKKRRRKDLILVQPSVDHLWFCHCTASAVRVLTRALYTTSVSLLESSAGT